MLIIRDAQMAVLEAPFLAQFETFMMRHLREDFTDEVSHMQDAALLSFIRYGVQSAKRHGATLTTSYGQYIDLMVVLGRDFVEDKAMPWASATLRDPSVASPDERFDRLSFVAARYIDAMPDEAPDTAAQRH